MSLTSQKKKIVRRFLCIHYVLRVRVRRIINLRHHRFIIIVERLLYRREPKR